MKSEEKDLESRMDTTGNSTDSRTAPTNEMVSTQYTDGCEPDEVLRAVAYCASMWEGRARILGNAEHITNCVNAHNELVRALRNICGSQRGVGRLQLIDDARELLAEVKK